jgi:hypothetical protein
VPLHVIFAWHYLRWGIATVFAVLAVELLYHFGPDMKQYKSFNSSTYNFFKLSLAGFLFLTVT